MAPWSDKAKEGESGLADRYQFTIREARFTYPYENAPNACALVCKGERNIDGNIEDSHFWLGVGEKFEPGDKEGTFAIHDSQDPGKYFNKKSKIGRFIKSALDAGVPLEENQDPARAEYETKDALMWEGLILDIEEKEESGVFEKGPDKGKTWTSRTPLVVAYLGKADGSAPAPAQTATNGTANGAVDPKSFATHTEYSEAYQTANGSLDGALDKEAFYAAKA